MRAVGNLSLAITACAALAAAPARGIEAEESRPGLSARPASTRHLLVDDTVGALLDHPAFTGFAPLLLPWDGRRTDRDMRLTEIASLMPYHSHVDPAGAVAALNRMIDDVGAGRAVFHDIYTEEQKRAEPAKARTGLFFFRGRPGAPFAIISPGGGFAYVGSLHEGFPYAVAISAEGYNAFVLRYRPGAGERAATEDLAAAISFVFRHAATLGVGTASYSLWGSSAGARMAANIGSHGAAAYGGDELPGPACIVMAYTAHADRARAEPATFALVGERDGIAPPSVMERRVTALRAAGTQVEFHVYPRLGHGFGLGTATAAEGWTGSAMRFWRANASPRFKDEDR
jgi:acetyl esterase/lipase